MLTWFLPFRGPPLVAAAVLILGPCLFNVLANFVSSRLQRFKIRLMMAQGIPTHYSRQWPSSLQVLGKVSKGSLHL